MPSKTSVITVAMRAENGPLQVELAIPFRRRRPSVGPAALTTPATLSPGPSRIPRVTRLMALAIKFQDMVDRGEVRDYADLARLGYVTRARLTQIMNLQLLAPDIQEMILFLPTRDPHGQISERVLRRLCVETEWSVQRRGWAEATGTAPMASAL